MNDKITYDFGGYATKNDVRCSDGRIIRAGAFKHHDGARIPLMWQHRDDSVTNVLGHAILENRDDGVYAYCSFNDSPSGQSGKEAVKHGDIVALSIYANRLVERSKEVLHGNLVELSLVKAGANPGAFIDNVVIHGETEEYVIEDEAIIYNDAELEVPEDAPEEEAEVQHAETAEKSVEDVLATLNEEQTNVVAYLLGKALEAGDSDEDDDDEDDAEDEGSEAKQSDDVQHADNNFNQEGANTMGYNVFENDATDPQSKGRVLSHADKDSIFADAKKLGSMKEAVEGFCLKHGIEEIDILFPDAKAVTTTPELLNARAEWVQAVISGTTKSPFTRIKSLTADLTLDEARAKGYVKGNLKREEFFRVAKRTTTPQTVYKKQKLDRDDVLDITDFDVVAWLKAEMRLKLDEEIARAILMGDGRSNADEDKIMEDKIRPIASDAELYVTTVYVKLDDNDTKSAEGIIDSLTLHRRHYRGSGNPTFFTSETILASMLLIKDGMGRRVYPTVNDLAAALRVRGIVAVEQMDDYGDLIGIMVNMVDYRVGTDKGGNVTMFDDFDIDYNQYKYLIEGRMSGALVKAKSAIVVRRVETNDELVVPTAPTFVDNVVTVPTVTGVTYKNKLTDVTLTTASPTTLAEGDPLTVIAIPADGYYFATDADDEWFFEGKPA